MEIIVGTAGHIDHGKTSLVRALTGTDADRLPEEKERGITIDLGFAELEFGGVHFGFVDVPGHERFIKNMLAGAIGIDLVLLVIAADEGVMPQTREHFEICRLLGIRHGIVVLTKKDLADEEMLELARIDADELTAGSFLDSAPVIAVSTATGEGIENLKAALADIAGRGMPRSSERITFLPIDRSFTVKGFGAVVTGTLASGEVTNGDELELMPDGRKVRVRGIQTHGRSVKMAKAGQRTAINLGGIDHSEIRRGMILAEPRALRPTQIFDAEIELLRDAPVPLRSRQRVRLHIAAAEVLARVIILNDAGEITPGERGFIQFRLESSITGALGERFIIRSYSPQRTIAGGSILLAQAEKHRRRDIPRAQKVLAELSASISDKGRIVEIFTTNAKNALSLSELSALTAWKSPVLKAAVTAAIGRGTIIDLEGELISSEQFNELRGRTLSAINDYHRQEPLAAGMSRETLRELEFRKLSPSTFTAVLSELEKSGSIKLERDIVRLTGHRTEMSPTEKEISERLLAAYRLAGFEPPKLEDALANALKGTRHAREDARKIFHLLLRSGRLIKVTEEFYFSSETIDELKAAIGKFAETSADRVIDVAGFKEIAGVSRKYAIPLLEYLDRERVTIRTGDKRVIRK